jgi:K+-transporting ATPase ATPase C chain
MIMPPAFRQHLAALRALLLFTVLLGLLYPLAVTGVAQAAFGGKADGSYVERDGTVVGSRLIGQNFTDSTGAPLREWFQPRPSAAGDGYDPTSSTASNLGPENPDLIAAVKERRTQVAEFNGVSPASVPADALTASGSGLDPDISPAYAYLQVNRVATARGLDSGTVRKLVDDRVGGRALGFIGAQHVNVLELNLALAAAGR